MKKHVMHFKKMLVIGLIMMLSGAYWQPLQGVAEEETTDLVTLAQASGYETSEAYRPQATIAIDAKTGQVLWENQADLVRDPASVAKLLSAYLMLEAIEQGKFTLDTLITATAEDEAMSQIYELSNNSIWTNVQYSVSDLLYATLVQSSNVATVMLARLVTENDDAAFIAKMNETAQQLGMTNSIFFNCSGAEASSFNGYYQPAGIDPEANNQTTARDLALLCYHLLQNYPAILTFTSATSYTLMPDTELAETFENHNYSLPGLLYGYDGVDGLKTGSSPNAAFNYAASAQVGDMRVIEIILGVGTWEDQAGEQQRHAFGNTILDQVFENYEYKQLLTKGQQTIDGQEIIVADDLYGVVQKGSTPTFRLENGQVLLNTDLSQIAPTIAPPSVAYQTVAAVTAEANQQTTAEKTTHKKSSANTFLLNALLIVLGLLGLLLSRLFGNNTTGRRGKKQKNNIWLLLIGLLCLIVGLALSAYSILVGPWI